MSRAHDSLEARAERPKQVEPQATTLLVGSIRLQRVPCVVNLQRGCTGRGLQPCCTEVFSLSYTIEIQQLGTHYIVVTSISNTLSTIRSFRSIARDLLVGVHLTYMASSSCPSCVFHVLSIGTQIGITPSWHLKSWRQDSEHLQPPPN